MSSFPSKPQHGAYLVVIPGQRYLLPCCLGLLLMLVLNVTVASGFITGIILYANIAAASIEAYSFQV